MAEETPKVINYWITYLSMMVICAAALYYMIPVYRWIYNLMERMAK